MTDNIRLIYNKIENRVDEICNDGFVLKENQQEYETLTDLEDFIDSLPKESGCEVNFTTKRENLEEEFYRFIDEEEGIPKMCNTRECIAWGVDIASHFAEWQKQKDLQDFLEKACDYLKRNCPSIFDTYQESGYNEIEKFKEYLEL